MQPSQSVVGPPTGHNLLKKMMIFISEYTMPARGVATFVWAEI